MPGEGERVQAPAPRENAPKGRDIAPTVISPRAAEKQKMSVQLGEMVAKTPANEALRKLANFNEKEFTDNIKQKEAAERSKVYENYHEDPAFKDATAKILVATNLEVNSRGKEPGNENPERVYERVNDRVSMGEWDNFAKAYPDKAKAYAAQGNSKISAALERQERRRLEQVKHDQLRDRQGQGAEAKAQTTPGEVKPAPSGETQTTVPKPEASAGQKPPETGADAKTGQAGESGDGKKAAEGKGTEAKTSEEKVAEVNTKITELVTTLGNLTPAERGNLLVVLQEQIVILQAQEKNEEKKPAKKDSLLLKILLAIAGAFKDMVVDTMKPTGKN